MLAIIRSVVFPTQPEDAKIAAVREALPATGAGIYLNTGTSGPLPRETARAMDEIATYELTVGRSSFDYDRDSIQRMAEARSAIAAILTADVETIALTHSITDDLNVVVWGLDWQPGDRVVTTSAEHAAVYGPLQVLAARRGVDVEIVDVNRADDAARVVAAFERAVTRATRLVVLSHVSSNTGAVLPVREVAELAHAQGAFVLVDGAQSAGAIAVDVGALGVDAYAITAEKWLLGPEAMGALWISPAVMDRVAPTFAGEFSFDDPGTRPPLRRWEDARRYEFGNYHKPSVVGFARSCGWLAMFMGLDWVYQRGASLARRTAAALAGLEGVELITPVDRMATIVTFRVDGWSADEVLDELGRRVFVVAGSCPGTDWVRFSVGFFNTEAELDRAVAAVGEIASYRPDTIPRRPALAILGDG
jgi:L-cysteine/cystine lyase